MHNYSMESMLEGHLFAGRLVDKEKRIVVDQTRNMVEPKNILINLKDKRRDRPMNIKQVYNALQR